MINNIISCDATFNKRLLGVAHSVNNLVINPTIFMRFNVTPMDVAAS